MTDSFAEDASESARTSISYRVTFDMQPALEQAQTRSANPVRIDPRAELERILAQEFDEAYYREQFAEGYTSVQLPLVHYLSIGWREGKNPNAWFDTAYYLEHNPDVRFSSVHPFVHYLQFGIREKRNPSAIGLQARKPLAKNVVPAVVPKERRDVDRLAEVKDAIRECFDAGWYARKYPEVSLSMRAPLDHFVENGWREGKDPAPWFSTRYYLASNVDVAQADINPFFHFLVQGKREGRLASHPGGERAEVLRNLQTMPARIASWTYGKRIVVDAGQLLKCKLAEGLEHPDFVISISHDVYFSNVGGIQTCIGREQGVFNQERVHYLHLSPSLPIPDLADNTESTYALAVAFDGRKLGDFSAEDLVDAISGLRGEGACCRALIVHHLLGHRTDFLKGLWSAADRPPAYFWIHDFFSVCKGYTLLRNDISFCGSPPADSNACAICVYGDERGRHLANMRALFESIPFVAVAPSAFALSFWQKITDLPVAGASVLEHCRIKRASASRASGRSRSEPLVPAHGATVRVAYAGHAVYHKGWEVFSRLVTSFEGDARYEFYHLGAKPSGDGLGVSFVEVSSATASMKEALVTMGIDVVVLWSVWPETYNIVAFECLAAGARIITNDVAGNIPAMVRKRKCGVVLEDEDALHAAFRSGELREDGAIAVRAKRAARDLVFSDMTAGLILNPEAK